MTEAQEELNEYLESLPKMYSTITPYYRRDGKNYFVKALSTKEYTQKSIRATLASTEAAEFTKQALIGLAPKDFEGIEYLDIESSYFVDARIRKDKDFRQGHLKKDDIIPYITLISIPYPTEDETHIGRESFIVDTIEYLEALKTLGLKVTVQYENIVLESMSDVSLPYIIESMIRTDFQTAPTIRVGKRFVLEENRKGSI